LAQDALDVAHEPCRCSERVAERWSAERPALAQPRGHRLVRDGADRVVFMRTIHRAGQRLRATIVSILGDVLAGRPTPSCGPRRRVPPMLREVLASKAAVNEELRRFSHLAVRRVCVRGLGRRAVATRPRLELRLRARRSPLRCRRVSPATKRRRDPLPARHRERPAASKPRRDDDDIPRA